MAGTYWNSWYSGWGWFLWFGIILLMFSGVGNWGYTYRVHRNYSGRPTSKDALDILSERYAKGEIDHDEYGRMKAAISS